MSRPKGIPNKKKEEFRERLRAYMGKKKVDPHFFMVDLIADDSTRPVVIGSGETAAVVEMPVVSIDHKLQAAKELAQYLEYKLRSMEVGGNADNPLRLVIETVSYAEPESDPPA